MAHLDLKKAKMAKKDEFYTQYLDIQKEINSYIDYNPSVFKDKTILLPCNDPKSSNFTKFFAQNFERFGIKKLISTSFVQEKEGSERAEVFTLSYDTNKNGKIDIEDLNSNYLEGNGDFRSEEVKKLRDEADIIITNPPFSLFREFLNWIMEADKKFLIIGNINCLTYKEVFLRIKENKIWLGTGMGRWISGFIVPKEYELYGTEARIENGNRIVSTNNCLWLTNLDHGKRHQPLKLMTMDDNIKFSSHKIIKEMKYPKYDNFNGIEVPFTDAIPSDYEGIMGVPITFLDKYNPEQFEIIGSLITNNEKCFSYGVPYVNGKKVYARILIKRKEDK